MMKSKKNKQNQNDVPYKKRGRPTGRNRVPLSLEERRARNAQYERERRNEAAEAMAQLAEVVGCDPNIANADILATVISKIQMHNSERNVDDLNRINNNLESQIVSLQAQLGLTDETFDQLADEEFQPIAPPDTSLCNHNERPNKKTSKRKRSRKSSEKSSQKEKRLKTRSETSNDSGIDMQRQSVSPTEIFGNTQLSPTMEQPPPLETIAEEEQHASQVQIDLQAELYAQIYDADTLRNTDSIPEWNDPCSSHSNMGILAQSLAVIPPIKMPEIPTDSQTTILEPSNVENEENIDLDGFAANEIETEPLPLVNTFDLLTDNEKVLINNWLQEEYLETIEFNNETLPDCNVLTRTL